MGIGNCFGSKSPAVRLQTGFPAAIIARTSVAILRITDPLIRCTMADKDWSRRA